MNVWLVSPAWRRFAVTRLALAQRAHLVGELAARGITANCVVIADDENLTIAQDYGFDTLERSNLELGRKFNDGIEHACRQGADFVVLVGSDDWVHPDLFERMPLAKTDLPLPTPERPVVIGNRAPQVLTGRQILLVDLTHGRARACEARNRHGVIPWILPRTALAPSGFRPIRDEQQRGIDGSLIAGLNCRPEWVFSDPHDLCRVDFKSGTNLNSYELIAGAIGVGDEISDPWSLLEQRYPAHLVEMARESFVALSH